MGKSIMNHHFNSKLFVYQRVPILCIYPSVSQSALFSASDAYLSDCFVAQENVG